MSNSETLDQWNIIKKCNIKRVQYLIVQDHDSTILNSEAVTIAIIK